MKKLLFEKKQQNSFLDSYIHIPQKYKLYLEKIKTKRKFKQGNKQFVKNIFLEFIIRNTEGISIEEIEMLKKTK